MEGEVLEWRLEWDLGCLEREGDLCEFWVDSAEILDLLEVQFLRGIAGWCHDLGSVTCSIQSLFF